MLHSPKFLVHKGALMFQHFVITRFNLLVPPVEQAKGGTPILDESWMINRLALFEQYCFSSLKAQTNQQFTWLVFFDIHTPEKFREKINSFQSEFNNFIPIFIDGMEAYLPSIKKEIADRLTQPYLITSRLDNDDCLHQDFIKEVQTEFDQQDFLAIDFVDGYTLQIEPEVRLAYRSHVHNPFISLIEKADDFVTVWSRKRHGQWSQVKKLKSVRNKRVWMSVIHIENATNIFLGYGDIDWQIIAPFHIEKKIELQLKQRNSPFVNWKKMSFKQNIKTRWKVTSKLLRRKLFPFLLN